MPIGILRLVYKTDPSGFLRPGDLEAVVEVGGLHPLQCARLPRASG